MLLPCPPPWLRSGPGRPCPSHTQLSTPSAAAHNTDGNPQALLDSAACSAASSSPGLYMRTPSGALTPRAPAQHPARSRASAGKFPLLPPHHARAVAYVRFERASSAALAIENLNGAVLNNGKGPKLKVMLAEAPHVRCARCCSESQIRPARAGSGLGERPRARHLPVLGPDLGSGTDLALGRPCVQTWAHGGCGKADARRAHSLLLQPATGPTLK